MRLIFLFFVLFLFGCALPRPHNDTLANGQVNDLILTARDRNINILAISGGGPNGAWSAGFLKGWHNKPHFDIVTGVSVGSIIASHAFVNQMNDTELEKLLVNLKESDFLDMRPLSMVVFNNSVSSNIALKALIDKIITNDLIDKVAEQGKSGERLYVGTTDLDFGKFRIWDLTDLARDKKYDEYRQVIMASASIPIVFSPVFLQNSMNVDGAVMKQVFVPFILPFECHKNIYVLHNGVSNLSSKQEVRNSIKDIAFRTAFLMVALNEERSFGDIFAMPNSTIFYSEISEDVATINFFSFEPEQVKKVYEKGVEVGNREKWNKVLYTK